MGKIILTNISIKGRLVKPEVDGFLDGQIWMTTCTSPYIHQRPVLPGSKAFQNPQKDNPLQPIISSRISVTYWVAKEFAGILKPLVGKTPHHLHNTQNFVQSIKGITLQPVDCITSYDVMALFTSVPVEPALDIIKKC